MLTVFKKKPKEEKKPSALKTVANAFSIISFVINIIIQLVVIGYLGYSIYANNGNLIANIALVSASALYLVFYIVMWKRNTRKDKSAKKVAKRAKKWVKLLAKAFTLGTLIYGAIIASEAVGVFEIITMIGSLIGWCISVSMEITVLVIGLIVGKSIEAAKKKLTAPLDRIASIFKPKNKNAEEAAAKPSLRERISGLHINGIFKKNKTAEQAPEVVAAADEEITAAEEATAEEPLTEAEEAPAKPSLRERISELHINEIFKKNKTAEQAPEVVAAADEEITAAEEATAEETDTEPEKVPKKPSLRERISGIRIDGIFKRKSAQEDSDTVGEEKTDNAEETANV